MAGVASGGLLLLALVSFSRARPDRGSGAATTAGVTPHFATADGAVRALVTALQREDGDTLRALLAPGEDGARYPQQPLLAAASSEQVLLEDDGDGCVRVRFGFVGVPLSVPLVREAAGWRFAPQAVNPSCPFVPPR